ncbi:MAG: hypothetical protein LBD68_02775 [Zoogloeaceae bacterium]|nr:hypothetical protein [Zoogloeaceae bacterium]
MAANVGSMDAASAPMARHSHDAGARGNDPAPAEPQTQQSQSDCCVNFVGILSLPLLSSPPPAAREAIAFAPSLRLSARVTGIYHPPRKTV